MSDTMKDTGTGQTVGLLDLLLRPELPNVQKDLPMGRVKIKRMSELLGEDVVFTLRALPYGRVQELKESTAGDTNVQIVLAGTVEPDLKAAALRDRYDGVTPAEVVKHMLLPGEIEDLSRAVEKLCGYRRETIEAVKNA